MGTMVIDMEYTYSMGAGQAFPLEIGAGETKTVSFINPKMDDNGIGMACRQNPFFSTKAVGKKARKLSIKVHSK